VNRNRHVVRTNYETVRREIARNRELNRMIISTRASLVPTRYKISIKKKNKKRRRKGEEKKGHSKTGSRTIHSRREQWWKPVRLSWHREMQTRGRDAPAILFLLRSSGPQSRHELFRTVAQGTRASSTNHTPCEAGCTPCFIVRESTFRSNSDRNEFQEYHRYCYSQQCTRTGCRYSVRLRNSTISDLRKEIARNRSDRSVDRVFDDF